MKKAAIEIKQILDINDPITKLLFTLGVANIVVTLITSKLNAYSIDLVIVQLVNLLFLMYILSCFRNGNCQMLSFIIAMITIILLISEITLRIFYPVY